MARRATGPVGFEEERFDAGTCGRQLDLCHSDRAVAEAVADDEEIVTTRLVKAHRPALAETMAGQSLRIVADDSEGALDDLFRHRAGDRFRSAGRGVKATAEERLGGSELMFAAA